MATGRALSVACMSCHGAGLKGTGSPAPHLRESAIALRLVTFAHMLREGRMEKGMPQFEWLSDDQIRQHHAYIRARAQEALGRRELYDPAKARKVAASESAGDSARPKAIAVVR